MIGNWIVSLIARCYNKLVKTRSKTFAIHQPWIHALKEHRHVSLGVRKIWDKSYISGQNKINGDFHSAAIQPRKKKEIYILLILEISVTPCRKSTNYKHISAMYYVCNYVLIEQGACTDSVEPMWPLMR